MIELGKGWASYLDSFNLRSPFNVLCDNLQKEFDIGSATTFDGGNSGTTYLNLDKVEKCINAGFAPLNLEVSGITGILGLNEDIGCGYASTYVSTQGYDIEILEGLAHHFKKYRFKVSPWCYVMSKESKIVSKVTEVDFEHYTFSMPYENNLFSDQYFDKLSNNSIKPPLGKAFYGKSRDVIIGNEFTVTPGKVYNVEATIKFPEVNPGNGEVVLALWYTERTQGEPYIDFAEEKYRLKHNDYGTVSPDSSWHRFSVRVLNRYGTKARVYLQCEKESGNIRPVYISDLSVREIVDVPKPFSDAPDIYKISCVEGITGIRPYYGHPFTVQSYWSKATKILMENNSNRSIKAISGYKSNADLDVVFESSAGSTTISGTKSFNIIPRTASTGNWGLLDGMCYVRCSYDFSSDVILDPMGSNWHVFTQPKYQHFYYQRVYAPTPNKWYNNTKTGWFYIKDVTADTLFFVGSNNNHGGDGNLFYKNFVFGVLPTMSVRISSDLKEVNDGDIHYLFATTYDSSDFSVIPQNMSYCAAYNDVIVPDSSIKPGLPKIKEFLPLSVSLISNKLYLFTNNTQSLYNTIHDCTNFSFVVPKIEL